MIYSKMSSSSGTENKRSRGGVWSELCQLNWAYVCTFNLDPQHDVSHSFFKCCVNSGLHSLTYLCGTEDIILSTDMTVSDSPAKSIYMEL